MNTDRNHSTTQARADARATSIDALAASLDDEARREISDANALRRYVELGDPRAFEVVTLRYRDMVLGTCLRALRSMADAEDATQETFLKLARNARDVRASVAAWLHRTAHTTSLDQLRRRGARQRAQAAAISGRAAALGKPEHEPLTTWAEMEPIIDAALAKLTDVDRELIVARFLAGRTQADIAHELGVNPGTVHRRLDAALDQLRQHLGAAGLVIAAGAIPVALVAGSSGAVSSPALIASLGKIALAEMLVPAGIGGAGSASSAGTAAVGTSAIAGTSGVTTTKLVGTGVAVVALGLALTTGGLLLSGRAGGAGGGSGLMPPVASAPAGDAKPTGVMARPSKAIEPARLVHVAGFDGSTRYINFDGGTVHMYFTPPQDFKKAVLEGKLAAIRFELERFESTGQGDKAEGTLKLVVREVALDAESSTTMKVGQELTGRWAVSGDGQTLVIQVPEPGEQGKLTKMVAFRVPGLTSEGVGLKAPRVEGLHPRLAGLWSSANELSLTIDHEVIAITGNNWVAERYKILGWTEAAGHAQVETICTGNAFVRGAIGKRVKLLIRTDVGGYALVHNQIVQNDKGVLLPETVKQMDQWPEPTAFDKSPTPPGFRLQRFAKELP
jgi:RNA polymerase sigma factor (sigma-70 family)